MSFEFKVRRGTFGGCARGILITIREKIWTTTHIDSCLGDDSEWVPLDAANDGMRSFFSRPLKLRETVCLSKSGYHTVAPPYVTKKSFFNHKEIQRALKIAKMEKTGVTPDYSSWSHESLIERVTQLENELKKNNGRYIRTLISCIILISY